MVKYVGIPEKRMQEKRKGEHNKYLLSSYTYLIFFYSIYLLFIIFFLIYQSYTPYNLFPLKIYKFS